MSKLTGCVWTLVNTVIRQATCYQGCYSIIKFWFCVMPLTKALSKWVKGLQFHGTKINPACFKNHSYLSVWKWRTTQAGWHHSQWIRTVFTNAGKFRHTQIQFIKVLCTYADILINCILLWRPSKGSTCSDTAIIAHGSKTQLTTCFSLNKINLNAQKYI